MSTSREFDSEAFSQTQRARFDPEVVRGSIAGFIEIRVRGRGVGYPPGVQENIEAVRFVAAEILQTPISPDRPFRTIERMEEYMSDIEQTQAFWYLGGGRLLGSEDEPIRQVRERIIGLLETQTPDPANTDETQAFVHLYERITPEEWINGRNPIERFMRRRKYGEDAEYNILRKLQPEQQIAYVKEQLPKLKKYKSRNSK